MMNANMRSLAYGNPADDADPLPHLLPENLGKYSLSGALLRSLGRDSGPVLMLDGLEGEVSQEVARRSGMTPRGFYLPLSVPARNAMSAPEHRTLTTASGLGATPTALPKLELIDVLRARMVTGRLGARSVVVPMGLLSIPRKTTTAAASWVAEGAAPAAEANFLADNVPVRPSTVIAYTDATRKYLKSTWAAGTDTIAQDLMASIAVEVDRVALNGLGPASNQPLGIMNNPALTVVPIGANGGPLTPGFVCGLEERLGLLNADASVSASVGIATTPNARSAMRQTPRLGSFGVLWSDENRVISYPAYATNNLPNSLPKGTGTNLSALIFANWDDLVIATWGVVDVLINPYQFSISGSVRIRAYLDVDCQLRHPESFLVVGDIAAA